MYLHSIILYICHSCSVPLKHETLSGSSAGLSFSPNTHRQQDTDTTVCTLWKKHGWRRVLPMVWWSVVTPSKEWTTRNLCLKEISITTMIMIKPDRRSSSSNYFKLISTFQIETKKYLFFLFSPSWHLLTNWISIAPTLHFFHLKTSIFCSPLYLCSTRVILVNNCPSPTFQSP